MQWRGRSNGAKSSELLLSIEILNDAEPSFVPPPDETSASGPPVKNPVREATNVIRWHLKAAEINAPRERNGGRGDQNQRPGLRVAGNAVLSATANIN
jgi:hypothetical protein